jgi:hypothetical protein
MQHAEDIEEPGVSSGGARVSLPLHELECLAEAQGATLSLRVDPSEIRLSWKVPGQAADVITAREQTNSFGQRFPRPTVDSICESMLERLGLQRVPTLALITEHMTPQQRARVRDLAAEMRIIKNEVLTRIAELLPAELRSGTQSSLSAPWFEARSPVARSSRKRGA